MTERKPSAPARAARRARRAWPLALALSVLAGAGGCGGGASSAVPKTFWGIVPGIPPTSRDLKLMRSAKVGTVRLLLQWSGVESAKGPCVAKTTFICNWTGMDSQLSGIARDRIQPLVTLGSTPGYISGRTGTYADRYDPLLTSAGRRGWSEFVTAAAKRYGPGGSFWREHPKLPYDPVRIWQVWNEQNSSNMFRPKPSPARYGALVKLTSRRIKAVDPSAQIVLGGMFGTPGGGGATTMTAWRFLDRLYEVPGAANAFDAVALHPYSPTVAGIRYQLTRIRKAMAAHDDGGSEIWLTELGWGSDVKHVQTSNGLVVSLQQQKRLLTRSFRLLRDHRSSWNIAGVTWYSFRDPTSLAAAACQFCASSGLLRNDYKPKPAWFAYLSFTGGSGG